MTALKKSAKKKAAPKKKVAYVKKAASKKKYSPQRRTRSNDCYITTACTEFFGLPDNCYQLMLLRKFRDDFMNLTKEDKKLVQLYYKEAPVIVKKIKSSNDCDEEFKMIFTQVNIACDLIVREENQEAKDLYVKMVTHLKDKYTKNGC